jgi:predicted metal-dependent HD superfamily phosphohydrolase
VSDPLDLEHWNRAWRNLGAGHPPTASRLSLLRCYAQPHRAYHTQAHIGECLALLESARALCEDPDEVAVALWFHDAIYRTHRRDNEKRSALWLAQVAAAAGVPAAAIDRMRDLVLATRHAAAPRGRDAQVLVDIDLAILGAMPERFDRFEEQIRREYRWVPAPLYRRERGKILAQFLARPRIYSTGWFHDRYEDTARKNLAHALQQLGSPLH